jgi:hypothetical protein
MLGKANQTKSTAGTNVQTVSRVCASTIYRDDSLFNSNFAPIMLTNLKIPINKIKA